MLEEGPNVFGSGPVSRPAVSWMTASSLDRAVISSPTVDPLCRQAAVSLRPAVSSAVIGEGALSAAAEKWIRDAPTPSRPGKPAGPAVPDAPSPPFSTRLRTQADRLLRVTLLEASLECVTAWR